MLHISGLAHVLLLSVCTCIQIIPLYIFSESYGGKMAAAFSQQLQKVFSGIFVTADDIILVTLQYKVLPVLVVLLSA